MATSPPHCGLLLPSISRASPSAVPSRWRPLEISQPSGLGLANLVSRRVCTATPLKAGNKVYGIEPDLPENAGIDELQTAGEELMDDFEYGYVDGHHTFHKEDENVDFWEAVKEVFVSAGGPTGGQAVLAWGTLPALYLMMAYGVETDYIFLAMVLFIFAFIGIEMNKPELDHEFPPDEYKERRKNRLMKSAETDAPVVQ